MKKKKSVIALVLSGVLLLSGCGGASDPAAAPTGPSATTPSQPGIFAPVTATLIGNSLIDDREKLMQFDYDDVTLQDGLFQQVYDGCMDYYDEITADDILWRLRKHAKLDVKTGRDLGWEAGTTNAECCLSQLISAKARRYAITGAEEDLQTVKDILTGYQEVINAYGGYPLMHNAYFYEKTLRAFMDCYSYCGLEQGYTMASDLVSYGMTNDPYKDPAKPLGDNATEWYTMAEALYMFAQLAKEKGESATRIKECIQFAAKYEYTEFWDIFYNDKNVFDYKVAIDHTYNAWFHAYSHANSFNSALEAYGQTGKGYYLEATQKFYKWLEENQKQATGGYGAQWEWLLPAPVHVGYLRTTNRSTETGCNSYATVNMDNYLLRYTADGHYGQWTEDAFYNMTIASLETENGCPTYYSDYSSDGGEKYLRTDWPWACCAGTRPLVMMEYLRSIYFHDTQNIYVNLYTNSSVTMTNRNGNRVTLSQNSDYPVKSTIDFTVNSNETGEFSICFRKPEWLQQAAVAAVNGEAVTLQEENGWLFLRRQWQDGDKISLELPMDLYYSAIYGENENDAVYAVMYGPVTLACSGTPANLKDVLPLTGDIQTLLVQEEGTLHFKAAADSNIVLKPYYEYLQGEKYLLYISTK